MTISQRHDLDHLYLASEEETSELVNKQPEAELVNQARSAPEAFGQLYDRYYSLIRNYIYRRTLNITTAEELTSNTFFKAMQALPKYKHQAPFCVWLYRIATNEIRMYRRSLWFRRMIGMSEAIEEEIDQVYFVTPEAHSRIENEERMKQYIDLHRALEHLPEPYQTVLILRYYENLEHEEISHVLGKQTGTIKSLVSRGIKRMAKLMKE